MTVLLLARVAARAQGASSVDLSAPLADTLAALLAQGAAALGVPAPSPLRAALALVAVTATLLGLATLRVPLPRLVLPRFTVPRLALPRLTAPRLALPRLALPRLALPRLAPPAPGDTRLARSRAMAAAGHPATEIARATGLSRDAIAILRHLPAA